ncbi:MAG: peptide ABC transporter ATP-binding protein [Chloroflexi bacterium RBG_13_51_52]|nr:MAG: peptide ABC transporter ATP-binding protein [Chloroflexi bacterium RBG_13_51_52]
MSIVLDVQDIKTYFHTEYGLVKAADGISFQVNQGEIIGIVGESGCGKSVSILSVMQLIQTPGEIVDGKVMFDGQDLLRYTANGAEMRAIRGSKMTMIFQEPMTSLNPVLTICRQVTESLELHLDMDRQAARERSIELLKGVGVPDAERRVDDYPHQFSGGMRQRVMIAMALSCNPRIIFADEPTTAVDVTTQAQLLELMKDLVTRQNTSLVIVTHNLGVVARYAQRIYVMYAGRIIESGLSDDIFNHPRHPYTVGLLNSVPRLGERHGTRKLIPIYGLPPNLINMPPTCAFLARCTEKVEKCSKEPWPALRAVGDQHYISCYVDIKGK